MFAQKIKGGERRSIITVLPTLLFAALYAVLFLLFSTLTACGFHLRGGIDLPPSLHSLYIKTPDPYGDLSKNLRAYLKQSSVNLATSADGANHTLEILSEKEDQQILSISGTQLTRQYNLILTVVFQLSDPSSGKILIPPQTVTESRTLTIQSNQILAGSNESLNLYQQMRRAIVFDIVNRLASRDVTTVLNRAQSK